MTVALQVVNPALPAADQAKATMTNFQDLETAHNNNTPQLLFSYITSAQQTIAGTAYKTLAGFNTSVTCNGGIVAVTASLYVENVTDLHACYIGLFIDNVEITNSLSSSTNETIYINWRGKLSSAQHSIALKARVNSNTSLVNSTALAFGTPIASMFIEQVGGSN